MKNKIKPITPADIDMAVNAFSKLSLACLVTDDSRGPEASKILRVNKAFADMFGYDCEGLIGKSPKIFQGADTDVDGLTQFRDELDSIGYSLINVINYRQDGTPFEVMLVGSRIMSKPNKDHNQNFSFVCFAYYISDAKFSLAKSDSKLLN